MGNDQDGSALADRTHVAHHCMLGLIVQGAGRLIQDQDARVADQCTRDRNSLALATGQTRALFSYLGVVAFG